MASGTTQARTTAATATRNSACSGCVVPNSTARPANTLRRRTSTVATPSGKVSASGWPSHCIDTVTAGDAASRTVSVRAVR